jgi:hypothetical protein
MHTHYQTRISNANTIVQVLQKIEQKQKKEEKKEEEDRKKERKLEEKMKKIEKKEKKKIEVCMCVRVRVAHHLLLVFINCVHVHIMPVLRSPRTRTLAVVRMCTLLSNNACYRNQTRKLVVNEGRPFGDLR